MRVRLALAALALLLLPAFAYADTVVLTSGLVDRQCSQSQFNTGSVFIQLQGPNFSLQAIGELPPQGRTSPCDTFPQTTGIGANAGSQFGGVTFNGVFAPIALGSVTFDEDSIFGTVRGVIQSPDAPMGVTLFTVDFVGVGFGRIFGPCPPCRGNFTVTGGNPVPEPATLALFGTGLAGVVGAARRRRKGRGLSG